MCDDALCVCRGVQGLRAGTRERIQTRPQAMLEAKDLPCNHLSSILEQRVLNAVAADRQQRALMQVGTMYEQGRRSRSGQLTVCCVQLRRHSSQFTSAPANNIEQLLWPIQRTAFSLRLPGQCV